MIDSLGAIFLDEIHLLGESGRGFILELVCTKALTWGNVQIVGMSATIPNLSQIARWLRAVEYETSFRPIPLEVNLCYKSQLWEVSGARLKRLSSVDLPIDLGQAPPRDQEQKAILSLLLKTILQGHQAMVFCPTKDWCEKMVKTLVEHTALIPKRSDVFHSDKFEEFREVLIEARIWPDSSMYSNVKAGICFHHAGLTTEERSVVEEGFRAGVVRILMATTTLSAGVNLPARMVIIRSPYGFQKQLIKARVFQQMCGRAGRKGIDEAGHAVLMCPNSPSAQKDARQLIANKAEMILSQLDRTQIQRAILEQIATTDKTTVTVKEIEDFISSTLYNHQLEDLSGKDKLLKDTYGWLKENEFITIVGESEIEITKLGEAAVGAGMPPMTALSVFDDLSSAARSLNLTTDLHLVYLCTPIQETSLNFATVSKLFDNLDSTALDVASKCQVDIGLVRKIARHGMPRKMDKLGYRKLQIVSRFYRALGIFDLINEIPIEIVSERYQVPRGTLQSLQISASQYAGMITIFCEKLGWHHLRNLLATFQNQIEAGVHRELLDLVRCPFISARRARQFYKLGFKRLKHIVKADTSEIVEAFKQMERFISSKPQTGENELSNEIIESRGMVVLQGINMPMPFQEAAEMVKRESFSIIGTETILDEPESEEDSHILSQNTFDNMTKLDGTAKSIVCEATLSPISKKTETSKTDTVIEAAFSDSRSLIDEPGPKTQSHLPEIDNHASSQFMPDPNDASMMESLNDSLAAYFNASPRSDHSPLPDAGMTSEEDESQELFPVEKKTEQERRESPESDQTEISTFSSIRLKRRRSSGGDSEQHSETLFEDECQESADFDSHCPDSEPSTSKKMRIDHKPVEEHEVEPTFEESLDNADLNVKDGKRSPSASQESSTSVDESIAEFMKSSVWDTCTKPPDQIDSQVATIITEIDQNPDPEEKKAEEGKQLIKTTVDPEKSSPDSDETFAEPLTVDTLDLEPMVTGSSPVGRKKDASLSTEIKSSEKEAPIESVAQKEASSPAKEEIFDESIAFEELKTFHIPEKADESSTHIAKSSPVKDNQKSSEETFSESLPSEAFTSVMGNKNESKSPPTENPHSSKSKVERTEPITETNESAIKRNSPISKNKNQVLPTTPDSKSKSKKSITPQKSLIRMDTVLTNLSPRNKNGLTNVNLPRTPKRTRLFEEPTDTPSFIKKWPITPKPPASDDEDETQTTTNKPKQPLTRLRPTSLEEDAVRLGKYISKHKSIAIKVIANKLYLYQRQYVYDFLKCEPVEGKLSNSVSKEVLEVLVEDEPRIKPLIQFRKATKAFSDLLSYKNASKDNRIYSTPVLINRTGRISMDNPSLQMVQNEFECCGKVIKVRNCFRTNPNYIFISVDYRQLELRVLALLSGDEGLRTSFVDHEDPFVSIGRKWLKRERISVEQRTQVKALVYGIIYGMGNKTLGQQLGVTVEEAEKLSSEFLGSYPVMHAFLEQVNKNAESNLYTETLIGRRRSFENYSSRAARVAVNTKIQGSAADIVKMGTVKAARKIRETGIDAKLVLQIHDELLFEVEEKDKDVLEEILCNMLPLEGKFPTPWTDTPILSVDSPSGWDVNLGPIDENSINPQVLISLSAPKPSIRHFKGRNFLGGRFLPRSIVDDFNLQLPEYPNEEMIVEFSLADMTFE
ncbi:Oidioi.mRNA.OKI2018_I69.XSR.g16204.t3.cds [Oikopleura dioica]|uniref:DNA-directed DNA polymerase n=1 Tax=Oikopleura dioica TaxID=34765 RepID=A0ABN7SFC3_OIKDI|nr:Oidioi.mRNA.OKI2018_I69.XSR.g16204.t3.cds [Oikopleura dioica]